MLISSITSDSLSKKELRVNALVEGRAVDDYLEVEEGFEVSIEDADAREGGEQN